MGCGEAIVGTGAGPTGAGVESLVGVGKGESGLSVAPGCPWEVGLASGSEAEPGLSDGFPSSRATRRVLSVGVLSVGEDELDPCVPTFVCPGVLPDVPVPLSWEMCITFG